MTIESINPENVRKVQGFVRMLLSGLDDLPEYSRINLLEQAAGLEQQAAEFRAIAAAQYQREQNIASLQQIRQNESFNSA